MKRARQVLVGLALVLFGFWLGLLSVPFLSDRVMFPLKGDAGNGGPAAAQAGNQQRPVAAEAMRAQAPMQLGAQLGTPTFAVSTLGRVAGRPVVEIPELLNSPFVQALLQLSDEQKEKFRMLDGKRLFPSQDEQERQARGVELARSQESAVAHQNRWLEREAILEKKQLAFARRLLCQLNQEYSFTDSQVAAELSLTAGQRAEMQRAFQSTLPPATQEELRALAVLAQQASHRRLVSRMESQGVRNLQSQVVGLDAAEKVIAERDRKLAEAFGAVCQKLRDVLTPEQMRQWDAMQGVRLEAWELDEIRGGLGGTRLATQP